ncbi:MAG TPA: hypothetical protein VM260_03235, partial [Pirellula sp.]|nr:hypothetical protein [Pirellula sp.]
MLNHRIILGFALLFGGQPFLLADLFQLLIGFGVIVHDFLGQLFDVAALRLTDSEFSEFNLFQSAFAGFLNELLIRRPGLGVGLFLAWSLTAILVVSAKDG